MTDYLSIHPTHPQSRLIERVARALGDGEVVVLPTDSAYALVCGLGNAEALERIRRIRAAGKDHVFTLMCRDLSEIATYARVDNPAYRALRAHTPGPYTFILRATREVPRRLLHPKRKRIGLRVPAHPIVQAVLARNDGPVLTTSATVDPTGEPLSDVDAIRAVLHAQVDLVVDGGPASGGSTSVVDLSEGAPRVLRSGLGETSAFAQRAPAR